MMQRSAMLHLYPEVSVGGFSRIDGTIQFFTRVNALLRPDMVVVDFGAGRGEYVETERTNYGSSLRVMRGKVRRVIGLDVDAAVLTNSALDEAHVIEPDRPLPLADASADLIVCDHTFEHLEKPDFVVAELLRILKAGGWICIRTPNKNGYIGVGGRIIPNRFHVMLLKRLQPHRKAIDAFPTWHRANSFSQLRRLFPDTQWKRYMYTWNPEPAYFANSVISWRIATFISAFLPQSLGAVILLFAQKK